MNDFNLKNVIDRELEEIKLSDSVKENIRKALRNSLKHNSLDKENYLPKVYLSIRINRLQDVENILNNYTKSILVRIRDLNIYKKTIKDKPIDSRKLRAKIKYINYILRKV